MESLVFKMLFIVSVSARFGKHVYVQQNYGWLSAQKHCRDHYTDLSPITSERDEMRLSDATSGIVGRFWIGLYKNVTHWWWSGGGRATYMPWDANEPDEDVYETSVSVCWHNCASNGWHNMAYWEKLPFLCFSLIVMEHKATWEQAMRHCRQKHTALTSLVSETEHLLALTEIQHDHVTEQVWIGLCYLESRWLWVNGDRLVYQAWHQGGDQNHQCPIWKRCGALTKRGLWENWDCQEKLNFICY